MWPVHIKVRSGHRWLDCRQRPSALTTLCLCQNSCFTKISTWICFQSPVSCSGRWIRTSRGFFWADFKTLWGSWRNVVQRLILGRDVTRCRRAAAVQLLWVDSLRQAAVLPRHKLHLLPRGLPCLRPSSCSTTDHLWENRSFVEGGSVITWVWGLQWFSECVNWPMEVPKSDMSMYTSRDTTMSLCQAFIEQN